MRLFYRSLQHLDSSLGSSFNCISIINLKVKAIKIKALAQFEILNISEMKPNHLRTQSLQANLIALPFHNPYDIQARPCGTRSPRPYRASRRTTLSFSSRRSGGRPATASPAPTRRRMSASWCQDYWRHLSSAHLGPGGRGDGSICRICREVQAECHPGQCKSILSGPFCPFCCFFSGFTPFHSDGDTSALNLTFSSNINCTLNQRVPFLGNS